MLLLRHLRKQHLQAPAVEVTGIRQVAADRGQDLLVRLRRVGKGGGAGSADTSAGWRGRRGRIC
eukprot:361780-Chlamydomonas_euryale.AAC.3